MDKPLLSVLMPAIRPQNWLNLYTSIESSLGSNDFELIFVSPYDLPEFLADKKNIKLVRDWGSPTRAFGIALELVEGEYITWAADDATYLPGQLAKVLDTHKQRANDKLVIAMEQTEAGRHYASSNCFINQHEGIRCNVPNSYVFFPTGLMKTSLYKTLGGLDGKYETHAMAHVDFAIRAQKYGVDVHFHPEIVLQLTHMMGSSGDHGPIFRAQTYRDEPLLRELYRNPEYEPELCIDIKNWRKDSLLWTERFKVSDSDGSQPKPDISIFLGGIRPFLWERLYNSIALSVGKYTFELVICGPNRAPELFANVLNFKYIRDFGGPARAAQLAALLSEGSLITLGADDAVYLEGELEKAIDFHKAGNHTVTALRYMEGGNKLPESYFTMKTWQHFHLPGVPDNAPMMLNSIMSRDDFCAAGGYDCETFSTCNWGGQDLTLRLLQLGHKILPYTNHVMSCDHDNQGKPNGLYDDHHPIYLADDMGVPGSDYQKFVNLYSNPIQRGALSFDSWTKSDQVWKLRFEETAK